MLFFLFLLLLLLFSFYCIFFVCSGQLQAVVEGQSVNGKIILTAEGKELEESFVDDQFDMEKLWAYLTIKDLLNNKTVFAENKVNSYQRKNLSDKDVGCLRGEGN